MKLNKILKKAISDNSGVGTQVAVAAVAGLAVGAALAVLFAPERGKDTRDLLGSSPKRFADQLKDIVGELKERFFSQENEAELPINDAKTEIHKGKKPKSDIGELIHEAHLNHAQPQEA